MPLHEEPNSVISIFCNTKMRDAQICIRTSSTKGDYVSPKALKVRGDSTAVAFVSVFQNPNNYYKKETAYTFVVLL
jgi:hypothetical protein